MPRLWVFYVKQKVQNSCTDRQTRACQARNGRRWKKHRWRYFSARRWLDKTISNTLKIEIETPGGGILLPIAGWVIVDQGLPSQPIRSADAIDWRCHECSVVKIKTRTYPMQRHFTFFLIPNDRGHMHTYFNSRHSSVDFIDHSKAEELPEDRWDIKEREWYANYLILYPIIVYINIILYSIFDFKFIYKILYFTFI